MIMDEEGEENPLEQHPRPRPTLRVILQNSRANGVLEFLTAIRNGNLEEAKVIFETKKLDPNVEGSQGETGLHLAARAGFLDCVHFLLEAGADVNRKERRRKYPLHLASSSGHLDVVRILINAGSNLDDVDKFGRSPLMWAAAGGYVKVVKLLLEAGASFTSQGNNWHALHEACKGGFTDLVQLLIQTGAPVNNPKQYTGGAPWSPLHIAVRQGHIDCIKLLINAGSNVNSVNAGGHTPLHEAAYRGYHKIMLELLFRGADPNATSNQKRTPLHEACIQGKVRCAVMLLDAGSDVNAQDLVRETPLHLTLRANHAYDIAIQLTTILLQYGASPSLPGRDEDLPYEVAIQNGQIYCLEPLETALEIPQPLLQICKVTLRKQLSCHLEIVEELPLPLTLKRYLTVEI